MDHEAGAGVRPSPNIWHHPDVYEIENLAFDPEGRVEAAMGQIVGRQRWGRVLDIGCGTGFHLPRWASRSDRVVGVEPHPPLVRLARERVRDLGLSGVDLVEAGAEDLPVADASVDVAHARWAYFFGPGCEAGLAELDRVMAPGGVAFVLDNDATSSTFGGWFRRAFPAYDPAATARFWRRQGWTRTGITTSWRMDTREDFEAVVRIEFAPALAEEILREHAGTGVDYAVDLWWRRY